MEPTPSLTPQNGAGTAFSTQSEQPNPSGSTFGCWHNGRVIPSEQATVPVLDHGLLYGDGVFEGMRFYHNQPFLLDRHLKRLRRSLKAIQLEIPYSDHQLREGLQQAIVASGYTDGYIRLLVTRGVGPLGLNPATCSAPNVFVIASKLDLVDEETRNRGIRVITSSIKRMTGSGLDYRIKSLNYLLSVMARMEANHAQVEEALLLNQQGTVAECSAENLFIVSEDTLLTPPATDGCLEGITRAVVMELAQELGMVCLEKSITPYDIYTAQECFLTGSGARLIPVRDLDGRSLEACPGPVYRRLSEAFRTRVDKECPRS